jgi:tripartite ATP-independent transporter DctM subunit
MERIIALKSVAPVAVLIMAVLGSIYMGIATVTEAAALGVLAAVLFALANRSLSWGTLHDCLLAAVKTTSMIILIVMGASFLSRAMGILGIPRELTQYIGSLDLSPYVLIIMLGLIYLLLGCILDGFSIVVMTLPIALPLTTQAGFDPIWFGVFLILMVELSQITPPVGFNLFVIQGLTGETISTIAKAAFPFFLLMILTTALLTIFPQIALYLPGLMTK